jgi:hypothetical protein
LLLGVTVAVSNALIHGRPPTTVKHADDGFTIRLRGGTTSG